MTISDHLKEEALQKVKDAFESKDPQERFMARSSCARHTCEEAARTLIDTVAEALADFPKTEEETKRYAELIRNHIENNFGGAHDTTIAKWYSGSDDGMEKVMVMVRLPLGTIDRFHERWRTECQSCRSLSMCREVEPDPFSAAIKGMLRMGMERIAKEALVRNLMSGLKEGKGLVL